MNIVAKPLRPLLHAELGELTDEDLELASQLLLEFIGLQAPGRAI
jgi:hypothetical protein